MKGFESCNTDTIITIKILKLENIFCNINLFAVKSNTLNRLFHPYGIIRRESKQHTALQKLLLYSKCTTKIFLITLIQKL